MNIHIQTLLAKMGEELALAKSAGKEELLREKISSIKTLCEVILEEGKGSISQPSLTEARREIPLVHVPGSQDPKLEESDGANGDSIFDF
ncbi:YwdI family protein [Bacillus sp. B-jedd]|uniref:YwdI family protein n=1 Tax=Bacillus sp. B-jedd TaxID=1476857 RepID=UPI00051562BE|nr:YwdI family protein [Bacillus sp. B-jedd]CEG29246.1 YwdI [Bacillus sp. B-jedd]